VSWKLWRDVIQFISFTTKHYYYIICYKLHHTATTPHCHWNYTILLLQLHYHFCSCYCYYIVFLLLLLPMYCYYYIFSIMSVANMSLFSSSLRKTTTNDLSSSSADCSSSVCSSSSNVGSKRDRERKKYGQIYNRLLLTSLPIHTTTTYFANYIYINSQLLLHL